MDRLRLADRLVRAALAAVAGGVVAGLRESDSDDQPTIHSRAYAATLVSRLRGEQPGDLPAVQAIPVGEVLSELDRLLPTAGIEGFDSLYDLYRDQTHLNNIGRYATASTTFATLSGEDPTGQSVPDWFLDSPRDDDRDLPAELATLIQQTAWATVPEPGSLALLAAGLPLVMRRRQLA